MVRGSGPGLLIKMGVRFPCPSGSRRYLPAAPLPFQEEPAGNGQQEDNNRNNGHKRETGAGDRTVRVTPVRPAPAIHGRRDVRGDQLLTPRTVDEPDFGQVAPEPDDNRQVHLPGKNRTFFQAGRSWREIFFVTRQLSRISPCTIRRF